MNGEEDDGSEREDEGFLTPKTSPEKKLRIERCYPVLFRRLDELNKRRHYSDLDSFYVKRWENDQNEINQCNNFREMIDLLYERLMIVCSSVFSSFPRHSGVYVGKRWISLDVLIGIIRRRRLFIT